MKKAWLLLSVTGYLFAVPNGSARVTLQNLRGYSVRALCYDKPNAEYAVTRYAGGQILSILLRRGEETREIVVVRWEGSGSTCEKAKSSAAEAIDFGWYLRALDSVENDDTTYVREGGQILCQKPSLQLTLQPDGVSSTTDLPPAEGTRQFSNWGNARLLQTVVRCPPAD